MITGTEGISKREPSAETSMFGDSWSESGLKMSIDNVMTVPEAMVLKEFDDEHS